MRPTRVRPVLAAGVPPRARLRTRRPAKKVQAELLERSLLVGTSADPNVVRLLPPLVVTAEEVDLLAEALAELPG